MTTKPEPIGAILGDVLAHLLRSIHEDKPTNPPTSEEDTQDDHDQRR